MTVISTEFSITASPDLKDDTRDIHYVPAPCQVACPIGTDAPSYIAYVWEGKNEAALEAINATNPFSAICGRVCDAPCEPACRRADSDGAIAIRNLKRYVLETLGPGYALPPVAVTREKTVAIVGAGPAGMTAAHDLAEDGYEVHLYEATDQLGGMMFWGIPRFRLPQAAVQQDIDRITGHCPGIKVHLNTALGDQVSLDELKQKHDVVLLSIGAFVGKPMAVPGETAPYVEDGVSFLYRVNAGEKPTLPETVLVIGGGDVAMDACRVAKRLPGVKNVKVIYRRDYDAMPARREELQGAIDEGIEIVYNTQPVEVIDGKALRCVRTKLGESDEDGRRRPINIEGSEHDIECGMVIAAVGQKTECAELDDAGLMEWDRVKTDLEGMTTGDPMVFAAGDGAFGGSTIVEAMYQGHRAAYYMKAFLEGSRCPTVPPIEPGAWLFATTRTGRSIHGCISNFMASARCRSSSRKSNRPIPRRKQKRKPRAASAAMPRPVPPTIPSAVASRYSRWRGSILAISTNNPVFSKSDSKIATTRLPRSMSPRWTTSSSCLPTCHGWSSIRIVKAV
jgi:NADPH-dependent glutamate synthase beta subunit-like oxidoreductase